MANVPTTFNVDPYYDDFSDDKKFVRFLFRPGYAVQARELTQLQTNIQRQLQRFGDHVFEDGSIVLNGQISENRVKYIRISGLSGTSDVTDLENQLFSTGLSGYATARILSTQAGLPIPSNDTYNVLFYEYVSGGTGFTTGDELTATIDGVPVTAVVTDIPGRTGSSLGDAVLVNVQSGVRYVDGFFVYHTEQNRGVYSLTGVTANSYRDFYNPTVRVGFDVQKTIVDSTEDSTLTDPAFGSYNYSAPGSDRYKIDLSITHCNFDPNVLTVTDNFSRTNFIEFLRLNQGVSIKKELYPDYAVLEETLARRTYDESGNYTVRPFEMNLDEGNSSDTLSANMQPGKAYVFGYEFETQSPEELSINRARGSSHERALTDQFFNRRTGPYAIMNFRGWTGSFGSNFSALSQPIVLLSSATGNTGVAQIGTARIRNIVSESSTNYRVYLYDIAITAGSSFENVKQLFITGNTGSGQAAFEVPAGTTASLLDQNYNDLLFVAPVGNTLKSIQDTEYSIYTFKTVNFNLTNTASASKESYTNIYDLTIDSAAFPDGNVVVVDTKGRSLTGNYSLTGSPYGTILSLTLNATGPTTSYVYTKESVTTYTPGSTYRTKTATTETISITGSNAVIQTDSQNKKYLYLNKNVDVFAIQSITGSNGTGITNMTNWFTLDTGQKDNYYDWSRIVLADAYGPSASSFTGPYTVILERFAHAYQGPFTVDSYLTGSTSNHFSGYSDIPSYTTNDGQFLQLRDTLDFRPARATNGSMTGSIGFLPTTETDNRFDYTHYLPRTDKIVITKGRDFQILEGVPDVNPLPPNDNQDAMTIYTVTVNPYTFNSSDATVRLIENKRYTMQDIGNLEKRVDNLEYYTTLSILEQEARNTSITDVDGIEMPKLGILVDTFKGHSIGDVKNTDYRVSIDYNNTELRPGFQNRIYAIERTSNPSSGITSSSDGIYTLTYSTTPFIIQTLVSTTANINPSGVFNYLGSMKIVPDSDTWYDDTKGVYVKVNVEGENDNWVASATGHGFGTQWNDWESGWAGKQLSDAYTQRQNRNSVSRETSPLDTSSALNIVINSTPDVSNKNNNSRMITSNILPYMRAKSLNITAKGLKPSTRYYPFFDNTDVSAYVSGSTLSDVNGIINGITFSVPAETFRTGRKLFRLTDSATNNVSQTTSAAEAIYAAEGFISTREDGIISTRIPIVRRDSVKSERITTNFFTRDRVRDGTVLVGAIDPMAQTFTIESNTYPSGVFIKKVRLFFSAKETGTNIPVILQIRPTNNGYPHPSKIIPFSEVIKNPSDVNVSDDASLETDFEFSSPIYLAPGEYSICLLSASGNYSVYTAEIGDTILNSTTNERVSRQAYIGKFYKPQNSGRYYASETEDLAFVVYRCDFTTSGNVEFRNVSSSTYGSGSKTIDVYRINTETITPPGTALSYSEVGALNKSIVPNENIGFDTKTTINVSSNFTTITTAFNGTSVVSPVLDTQRFDLYAIETLYGSTGPTGNHISDSSYGQYISKSVRLADGIEGANIHVFLNAYQPPGTEIRVFAKYLPSGDSTLFENRNWELMTTIKDGNSNGTKDYKELHYSLSSDVSGGFNIFAIKILLLSPNSGAGLYSSVFNKYPIVRNMRALVV